MRIHHIILSLISLTISCKEVERPLSKALEPENNIQVDLKESNGFEFDDFFSGIEVVPLETSRDAILGNPKKMLVRKGCYYIHNAQQNCVTGFDADGKLTFSSRSFQGEGPEEYKSIRDYFIDEKGTHLYIFDEISFRVTKYSFQSGFVEHIDIPENLTRINAFTVIADEIFAFYSTANFGVLDGCLLLFDSKSRSTLRLIDIMPSAHIKIQSNTNIFYNLDGMLHFNHSFPSLSTYCIDPSGIVKEKYKLDFGKATFDTKALPNNKSVDLHNSMLPEWYQEYAVVFDKFENEKYFFTSFFHKAESGIILYQKSTKKQSLIINKDNASGFQKLLPPYHVDDQALYYLCLPEHLEYYADQNLKSNSARLSLSHIDSKNNYIIVKYLFSKN